MQYKDLLRGTVLLVAFEGTILAGISAFAINSEADDVLAAVSLAWWAIAMGIGVWLGRPSRTVEVLAGPLAAAKTATQLPSESPARIAFMRLWPVALFAILAGVAAPFVPQVTAIAAGFAFAVAGTWRNRESAVAAVEERDGVCFFIEYGNAFEAVKLIRTPGLRRDALRS